ncbi:MAG: type III-B CRISPR module RAMP protein Cmr6 [Planctomycetota bacterium]
MREVLRDSIERDVPDHLGLAYDTWAPTEETDGKVSDDNRSRWLEKLADLAVSPDYATSYDRWEASFSSPEDRLVQLTLTSRLLVGHGNSSATGVGLTVHHTWGVPIIPGSAVKGLVAHYVDATYGPTDPDRQPWEQQGEERARADYQGVTWNGRRLLRGPGAVYRALFGAPEAQNDESMREHGLLAGAAIGLMRFHDAVYVPASVADDKPFAMDVLTPHQQGKPNQPGYYDSQGATPPNDYTSPVPVPFLTVRPGARLLFALSGPDEWTKLAESLLRDALESWGIGGKTSAGYGRLLVREELALAASVAPSGPTFVGPIIKPGATASVVLLEERTKKGGWKARYELAGLEGPIQNNQDVPADKKPGDQIFVEVKIAKGKQSGFRYLGEGDNQERGQ